MSALYAPRRTKSQPSHHHSIGFEAHKTIRSSPSLTLGQRRNPIPRSGKTEKWRSTSLDVMVATRGNLFSGLDLFFVGFTEVGVFSGVELKHGFQWRFGMKGGCFKTTSTMSRYWIITDSITICQKLMESFIISDGL